MKPMHLTSYFNKSWYGHKKHNGYSFQAKQTTQNTHITRLKTWLNLLQLCYPCWIVSELPVHPNNPPETVGWGLGTEGQLGYGDTLAVGDDETPSAAGAVAVGGAVTSIAADSFHTCALLADQTVKCWGRNTHGQLGYGNTLVIGDDETPELQQCDRAILAVVQQVRPDLVSKAGPPAE